MGVQVASPNTLDDVPAVAAAGSAHAGASQPRAQRLGALMDLAPSQPRLSRKAHAPLGDLLLLGGLSMFGSIAMDMYLPALPRLTRALHASPDAAQTTISIFLVGLAVGQLVYGPLSDRVGRRPPVLIGVGLYLAASSVLAVAANIETMIAARFVQGVGACAGMVMARAVVRDRYDDDEVLYIYSLLTLVFGVAPVLAPLVGGWVLTVADWRWIFGVQALFGVGVGAWAWLGLPETRSEATRLRASHESAAASYLLLLRQPRLTGCLLTGALAAAGLFTYITAAPEVVITLFHIAPQKFGWVFGINSIGMIAAGQANAWLARRIPGVVLLRTALYAGATSAGVLLLCACTGFGGVWGVLVPLFFAIGCFGFTQPNTTAAAMTVDRGRAGSTSALLGAITFGVGGLAGVALAILHDGSARPMAEVILGSVLLAILAFHVLMHPRIAA